MKLLAIWAGKIALVLTRVFHLGSGTTLPGLLAEKIDKNIIRKLSSNLKNGAIVVTGTNGKTTASKMLVEILSDQGLTVLHNPSGSNLTRGIASALINSASVFGMGLEADIAVFEVDEATMPEAMTKIRPKVVLVTNLFRDQLDRYGELDKTAAIIGGSLRGFTDLTVVLNADDPLVTSLSKSVEGKTVYFGIEDPKITTVSTAAMDSKDCLECGHELKYASRYFGHLGIWKCPNCGQARPKVDYAVSDVVLNPNNSGFNLLMGEESLRVAMQIPGLYNIYNALSAAAVAKIAGSGGPAVAHALKNFSSAFGRMETLEIEGRKAMLLLIKNPTGANQALFSVLSDVTPKNILLCLNDNFADGTDISWIWDVDLENLNLEPHFFVVSGIRSEDMALRLKYAGVKKEKVYLEKDPVRAINFLIEKTSKGEYCYVFPTYTAMIEIRGSFAGENDELSNLGKVTKRGM